VGDAERRPSEAVWAIGKIFGIGKFAETTQSFA
jgi:hypothetical protein